MPPSQQLHVALAMAALGRVERDFLVESIASARPEECRNLIAALRLEQEIAVQGLRQQAEKAGRSRDWPQKARLAIVALYLGDSALAREMLPVEQRPDPVERTVFIKTFPIWHGDVSDLLPALETADNSAIRCVICCAMGSVSPDALSAEERKSLGLALQDWYRNKPDAGTHSAAGFALGRWKLALPPIAPTTQPQTGARWYVNSVGMTMALIPAGEFLMGLPDSGKTAQVNAKPQLAFLSRELVAKRHRVRITKPFWLGMHPVTVGQFRTFVEDTEHDAGNGWQKAFPSQTDDRPVVGVSWGDANAFCDWLTRKEGKKYGLPTEAQWEYACRAGTRTIYSFGDNESDLGDYAWFDKNSYFQTHPVGQKLPNAWGLSDMHGNAWQWCEDWYDGGYFAQSPTNDPRGPATGSQRMIRGGSWRYPPWYCRSGERGCNGPEYSGANLGFRVSQVPVSAAAEARSNAAAARRLALIGKPLQVDGTALDGKPFDWNAYRGKVTLIEFWTTYSAESETLLAATCAFYDLYHDVGLEVVGVSLDENRQLLDRFLAEKEIPWATLHTDAVGLNHPLAVRCGVCEVPMSLLVDRDGKVVSQAARADELAVRLRATLGPPFRGPLTYLDFQLAGELDFERAVLARQRRKSCLTAARRRGLCRGEVQDWSFRIAVGKHCLPDPTQANRGYSRQRICNEALFSARDGMGMEGGEIDRSVRSSLRGRGRALHPRP